MNPPGMETGMLLLAHHAFSSRRRPHRRTMFPRLVLTLCIAIALSSHAQTFRKSGRFSVGPNPSAIAAVDLNDDTFPEIITADTGNLTDLREERPGNDSLSYLIARKALQYEAQPELKTGFGPYCIQIANIDGLKAPDIIAGSFHASRNRDITFFRNVNDQMLPYTLTVPDTALGYARQYDGEGKELFCRPGITSLVVRDFDRDGYRDILATGWASDVLIYFRGLDGDNDLYFDQPVLIPAPGGPRDLQVHDFDGDGHLDIVAVMYNAAQLMFWRGDGKGGFTRAAVMPTRGLMPHKIRIADMNQNGIADLVVSHCHTEDALVIYYGDGKFNFSMSQEIMLGKDRGALEQEIRDIVVEDLNGNGRPDIAAACFLAKRVVVLFNQAAENQYKIPFTQESYPFDGQPRALCVADFDQNGSKDLGVALWGTNRVELLLGR
jgi:hypothetical protein